MKLIFPILSVFLLVSGLYSQPIDQILSALDSSDYAQQAKAEKELFEIISQSSHLKSSNPSSWSSHKNKLIQLLQDKGTSLNKKTHILRILGKFGSGTEINALEPILYVQNEQLREEARQAILYIGGERAKQCFRKGFQQASIAEKSPFLEALVVLKDRSFSEKLVPYISSPQESLSIEVIEALGNLGDTSLSSKLWDSYPKSTQAKKEVIASALVKLGTDRNIATKLFFSSTNPSVQSSALKQLLVNEIDSSVPWDSVIPTNQRGSVATLGRLLANDTYPNRDQFFKVIMDSQNDSLKKKLLGNVNQFSDLEKQVIISAIASNKATGYESDLISLLGDKSESVSQSAIYSLGKIGSKRSYPSLYPFFQKNSKDSVIRSALSGLAYPALNQKLVETIKDSKADLLDRIFSVDLLSLRDATGHIELMNELVQKPSTPSKLQKQLIKIIESGNLKSAKVLLSLILKEPQSNLPDLQLALKNLSIKLSLEDQFWKNHLKPVLLQEGYSSKTKNNIIRILDPQMDPGVFTHVNQQIISEKTASEIRSAYLGNLRRWRSIETGWIWLDILKSSIISPTVKSTAKQQIIQLLSLRNSNHNEAITKVELIKKTLPVLVNDQDKIATLKFLNSNRDRHLRTIRANLSSELQEISSSTNGKLKELVDKIISKG